MIEMTHVSDSLREVLAGCGMHDRTAGTVMVAGIGDGERSRESALNHQPTGEGGELRSMGMGLEKDAGRNRRQFTGRRQTEGETTLMVAIATMKGARVVRTAPLMLIMDGGKS